MKMKKLFALLLALVMMASLLAGCGASSKAYDSVTNGYYDAPEADYAVEEVYDSETVLSSTDSSQTVLPADQKIITTMYVDAETENMDPLLNDINAKITELGGYMESQEIYNGSSYNSYRYRYAYLTVRIPADKLDSFVNHVSDNANIISRNTSTENVTLSYIATESRITALETEQERLLELLAMAENMEDLLLIESRLTEVRTELEQVTSVLRSYDNRINYSTINLNINEVKEYTDTTEPETFWERISSGFVESLNNVGEGIVDFFVFIIVALPYLLPFIIVAVVIIIIVKAAKKKKKKKQTPPPAPQPPEQ